MQYDAVQRTRALWRKLTASPTLPLLGWTMVVESLIAAPGDLLAWVAYSSLATVAWVYADVLAERVEDATDAG